MTTNRPLFTLLCAVLLPFMFISPTPSVAGEVRGIVVDSDKKPVANVEVKIYYGSDMSLAKTDGRGHFVFNDPERSRHVLFVAQSDGGRRIAKEVCHPVPKTVTLQLQPAKKVTVTVHDKKGMPLIDADVGVTAPLFPVSYAKTNAKGQAECWIPGDSMVDSVYAFKDHHGMDYEVFESNNLPDRQEFSLRLEGARLVRFRVVDQKGQPLQGIPCYPQAVKRSSEKRPFHYYYYHPNVHTKSNAQGIVEFAWWPKWHEGEITVVADSDKRILRKETSFALTDNKEIPTITLERTLSLRGRVTYPDGKPAAKITVIACGGSYERRTHYYETTTTDADGNYEFFTHANRLYMLMVRDDKWGAAPIKDFVMYPGQPRENMNFQLVRGTKIIGRLTKGPPEQAMPGQEITIEASGSSLRNLPGIDLPNPKKLFGSASSHAFFTVLTDENGRFECCVGPGKYWIRGPHEAEAQFLEIKNQEVINVRLHLLVPGKSEFKAIILSGKTRQPVPNAEVQWRYFCPGKVTYKYNFKADAKGVFSAERLVFPMKLYASSPDKKIAGMISVSATAKEAIVLLHPTGNAQGRVIDENGKPLANENFWYGIESRSDDEIAFIYTSFGDRGVTDKDGRFTLKNLILGQEYSLWFRYGNRLSSWRRQILVTQEEKIKDLGDLERPVRLDLLTLAEKVARTFASKQTPGNRFAQAVKDAKLAQQHVLVLFSSPKNKLTQQIHKFGEQDRELEQILDSFQIVRVSTDTDRWPDAEKLAKKLKVSPKKSGEPLLCLLDSAGKRLGISDLTPLLNKDQALDPVLFKTFLQSYMPPILDARALLDDALARAKKENKKIILQETATSCPPCWLLARYLDQQRPRWSKDYLWVKIDWRWHHSRDVIREFRKGNTRGIPWMVMIDSQKKILGTSDGPKGNYGFPSTSESINHFMTLLSSNRQRMTDADLQAMRQALEKRE